MRSKKRINKAQNIHLAIFFCGFLLFLIIFSLVFKSIQLFQKSGFDGKHRFTIAASFTDSNELISFSPETNDISVLLIPKEIGVSDIQKKLKISVDGNASLSISADNIDPTDISSKITKMAFSKESDKRVTEIDYLRLYFFTKSIQKSQITIKKITSENDILINDKIISGLFSDHTISEEQVTIQITNGTGKEGVGNSLARLITNSGGNVISVGTGKTTDESRISFTKESYTLNRLSKILGFKKEKILEKQNQQISDIIITIGKDGPGLKKF